MRDDTRLQHPAQVVLPEGNRPVVSPVYHSVKFTVENYQQLFRSDFFYYSRMENPTLRELEQQLASLQGCEEGLALASGCAAISSPLFALLQAGDHVIHVVESYKPTRYLIAETLGKFGVTQSLLSINDHPAIAKAITPKTKLMVFESPTNPMLEVADLNFLTGLAKKHGILTVLDNTFAGFFAHHGFPIDLYLHSLTKFAIGHGDAMGGVILGKTELISKIRYPIAQFGAALDPGAAFLALRGLKTYNLRRRQQCATALAIARFLEKHPAVDRVSYPGLESHPRTGLAQKQMPDFGAILAFDLKHPTLPSFFDHLKLFTIAASVGSSESLAAPVQLFYAKDLSPEMQRVAKITDRSIRLSIGLEAADDLIADLDRALAKTIK